MEMEKMSLGLEDDERIKSKPEIKKTISTVDNKKMTEEKIVYTRKGAGEEGYISMAEVEKRKKENIPVPIYNGKPIKAYEDNPDYNPYKDYTKYPSEKILDIILKDRRKKEIEKRETEESWSELEKNRPVNRIGKFFRNIFNK